MNQNLFYRHGDLQMRTTGDRNISLSFSSEAPVTRWFGTEVLLHGSGNVDLARIQAVGSLIYGHDPSRIENILGRINRAWLDNRKGYAEVDMDNDQGGKAALAKIQSGSIRGISVGYQINEARQLEEKEIWTDPDSGQTFTGPGMVATRWTPYEISLTPVPADPSVGIGRDLTRSLEGIHIVNQTTRKDNHMDKNDIRKMVLDEFEREVGSKVKGAMLEAENLRDHAQAIGPDAQAMVEEQLRFKTPVEQIYKNLLDMAGITPNAGAGSASPVVIRSFKQISDEQFFAGLSNPSAMRIDEAPLQSSPVKTRQGTGSTPEKTIRSFKQIDDDAFFAGLANPVQHTI